MSLLVWAAAAGFVLIVAAAALVIAAVAFSLERALRTHVRALARLTSQLSESDARSPEERARRSLH